MKQGQASRRACPCFYLSFHFLPKAASLPHRFDAEKLEGNDIRNGTNLANHRLTKDRLCDGFTSDIGDGNTSTWFPTLFERHAAHL